jgi:hypothetical protein
MAVPGLNANQLLHKLLVLLVLFLKADSNVTSLKCMTRAEAGARYHLMQTGTLSFSGYASNRLL